jgi:predicted nuclease of restriction endonuclease-like (RecB) superfamily
MSELAGNDYAGFLVEIKTRIRHAQCQALRAVNKELLALYWDIGESIHRKQEALGWGRSVVETLAGDLQAEFPGRNGFSAQNLWYMRQFYVEYRDQPNLQPLVGEISWAKNLVIMSRCKDLLEREFYLRATARFGWTKAVLQHQIDKEALDTQERIDGENPPIGIIICRDKNKTVVEYALRTAGRPIGVATYTVVPQLPETYRDQLPSPEAIAERLRLWAAESAQQAAADQAEGAG